MRNPYMIHPLFAYLRYDAPWTVASQATAKVTRTLPSARPRQSFKGRKVEVEYQRFLRSYPTVQQRVKDVEMDVLSKYSMMHAYGWTSE